MTYLADHSVAAPMRTPPAPRRTKLATTCPKSRDARWAAVSAALVTLRDHNRHSVRIVDADCGNGTLLLCAVQQARALGFTAIEARGIDTAPARVARARAAAATVRDPAIAIAFETGDLVTALDTESDLPADIVVWHGARGRNAQAEARAVACAGRTLIADPVPTEALAA